jgi:hypothetical protein
MKSFKNFYDTLPQKAQKRFKSDIMQSCFWKNEDLFYKKMRGDNGITSLESKIITEIINKKYKKIFSLARQISFEIDEFLKDEN